MPDVSRGNLLGAHRSDFLRLHTHGRCDAGFDDEFIYQQIPLETSARAVPTAQVGREIAVLLFDDWALKADKVSY